MFEESLQKIFKTIFIDYNFQFPLSWTWIGINGAIVTGRYELKKDGGVRGVVLNGKPKSVEFPINALVVDGRGQAVHILFKDSMEFGDLSPCRVDEPAPATPPIWPGGMGKA